VSEIRLRHEPRRHTRGISRPRPDRVVEFLSLAVMNEAAAGRYFALWYHAVSATRYNTRGYL